MPISERQGKVTEESIYLKFLEIREMKNEDSPSKIHFNNFSDFKGNVILW